MESPSTDAPTSESIYIETPSTDVSAEDRKNNFLEFEMARHDNTIQPNSKYQYDISNQIIWWWNDSTNTKPIEMTVALPAFNCEKIIWLALESLKNQTDINFAWELICFEEFGKSRDVIKSYIGQLPGCARIVHRNIDPTEGVYKKSGRYTLLEKWINIANIADNNSKIYVKHACDDYSSPKRLYIHYKHFEIPACHYSTQPKGYFYNILTEKFFLYDGMKREKSKIVASPHLNMALRTAIMKKISLPVIPIFKYIDAYIFKAIVNIIKINPNKTKMIFCDDEVDKDNWKYSLATDGYNIISLSRRDWYVKSKKPWIIPCKDPVGLNVPDRLKLLK